jgi:transposase-like protein
MKESQDVNPSPPRTPLTLEQRIRLIVEGLSGKRTVAELCREMGVSRERYYEMAREAMEHLSHALAPKKRGRKLKAPDPEKESLRQRIAALQKEKAHLETLWRVAQRAITYRVREDAVKKTSMARHGTRRRPRK